MKHLFIINPISGIKKAKTYIPIIEEYFQDKPSEVFKIIETTQKLETKQICKQYAQEGGWRIYIAGGDGTLNEAANGVAGTDTPIGILPAGSGNDFIKCITQDINRVTLVADTINGNVIKVDGIQLKDDKDFGYSINIVSMGLDAEAAYNATYFTRKIGATGMLSYTLGLFRAMSKKRIRFDIKITVDEEVIFDGPVLLAACTNGKYYGGGFSPVPYTSFDDGILDLCAAKAKGVGFIFRLLPKYMKGKHTNTEGIFFAKGKSISLESEDMLRLNIEGEIVERKRVDMQVMPGFFNIIKPLNNQ